MWTHGCHPCRGELYPVETDVRLCDVLSTGTEIEVDMEKDVLTNLATGEKFALKSLGDVSKLRRPAICHLDIIKPSYLTRVYDAFLQAGPVIDAGGLFDYARSTGMIKTA